VDQVVGTLQSIARFPVKSMQGESLAQVMIEPRGLPADRTHAVLDVESGKLASAKDPRRWARLLAFTASFAGDVIEVTFPDGGRVRSDDVGLDRRLSTALDREVQLCATPPANAGYDYVWEVDDLAPDEIIAGSRTGTTDEGRPVSTMPLAMLAPGSFQDVAPVTLLTTAALATMASHHPAGDWSPARFRSNLVIAVEDDGIVENEWVGRRVAIGDAALEVVSPSPRCVMTTLPQRGLTRDKAVLQAIARHNRVEFAGLGDWACLGAYATVAVPGEIAVGDEVVLTA
jgi:uncharacterized protein YcbX